MNLRTPVMSMILLFFAAAIVACGSDSSVEKSILVAPQMVDCVGVAPQKCLLLKEHAEDDWELWYESIEGFEFEQGFLYELLVEETTIDNPPADASGITLVLSEVISKTPVAIKTVYIGPQRVECVGEGAQLCYQYKENPAGDWLLYYSEIDGFDDYEEGFNYELLVAETNVENPPAGGSSTRLTLVEVVEKSKIPQSLIGTIWSAKTIDGQPILEDSEVLLGISDERVGGFGGCNSYFGPYSVDGDQVSVGPLTSTRVACDETLMTQETNYLAAFESTASAQITDDELQLANDSGEIMLTFEIVPPAPLQGTQWELTTYNNGQKTMVSVLPGTRITALFDKGQVSGSAGCNNYNGPYVIDGNNISIGPLASTVMMCADPEGIMEQEVQYLSALGSVAKSQVIADRLELISESGELAAMFTVAKPTSLVATPWQILAYNNGQEAVVSVINGTEITALFVDGNVSGSAGCNDYNASYELDGENITIGPAVTTRKFCEEPEGVMDQETEFLSALKSAATYQIDGPRLDMFTTDGARALNAQDANSDSR